MESKPAFMWKPFLLALFSMIVLGYGAGLVYNHFKTPEAPDELFESEEPPAQESPGIWQDEDPV